MYNTAIILADGFEEVEALTVVDLLRRAQIGCDTIALADAGQVTGSHGITVTVDGCFSATELDRYDGVILPGGSPGTNNLAADARVITLLQRFYAAGKLTAAICAAPTVLAKAGLLDEKDAVCYPGMEEQLTGARLASGPVAIAGTVFTSRGVGTAIPFALALVEYFSGEDRAHGLAKDIVYR